MRILVGIMHCIENELDQCLASVDAQTLPAHDRFVVSQLPNKLAHDTLYSTFMERADECDLFLKLDADMVLQRPTFFRECADRFAGDPDLHHLQITLDDWMTNRRICGLHIYRSTHRWERNDEAFFVDTVDVQQEIALDTSQLAPAAIHCPDPSPWQAYHFGLHKGVKFTQKSRQAVEPFYRVVHWNHFEELENNYYRIRDRRLGLAVLGFLDAIRLRWGPAEVDFNAEEPRQKFDHWNTLSEREIRSAIRNCGLLGSRWIPHSVRFEYACLLVSSQMNTRGGLVAVRRLWHRAYRRECPPVF